MYDLLIKGGTVIDGTRFPRYRADIAITDGVIRRIGAIQGAGAKRVIDASGLIVAPGHVDIHTHYDAQINWDPYCSNSGENGVTTVVGGNCGFGFAPVRPTDHDRYMRMMENTEQISYDSMKTVLTWDWESFPDWMEHLRRIPKGVNIMMFLPLNPLMVYVMGVDDAKSRRATADEMKEMQRLIGEAMEAGAAGIALSHLGPTNNHTDFDGSPMPTDVMYREDAMLLASALRERDEGVIMVLSALPGVRQDWEFAAELFEASNRPVLFNIFITSPHEKGFYREQLKWLEAKNAAGARIYGQSFLATAWLQFCMRDFNLNDHVADWREITKQQDLAGRLKLMGDPDHRAKMRASYDPDALHGGSGDLAKLIVTETGGNPELDRQVGRLLSDIAKEEDKHVLDAFFDLVVASGGLASFRSSPVTTTDVEDVAELMKNELIVAGNSDGGAHSKSYIGGHWPTELVIKLSRDTSLLSLEEMHYRLAYQAARCMGLQDRGAILEGLKADLVVYDLDGLAISQNGYTMRNDQPNGDWRYYLPTTGYRYIVVNGEVTFVDGVSTGALPGEVLGPPRHDVAVKLAAE